MTKVYVEVQGGNVVGAYSRSSKIEVIVCDLDDANMEDESAIECCNYLEKHMSKLHDVM